LFKICTESLLGVDRAALMFAVCTGRCDDVELKKSQGRQILP
jgi:hypothetical protein